MFDNVPQKSAQQAPQDMFESVERAPMAPPAPPQIIAPPPSALPPAPMPSPMAPMVESSSMGAGKIILIVLAGLLVLGASGALGYWFMMQPASEGVVDSVPSDNVIADDERTNTPSDTQAETTNTPEPTEQVSPATLLDSDGDGLMNSEELEAGTSITKADTDGDGLGDREEVQVYDTDPKDPDTDGDGYLDGQEVAGGYNPNGEGRLFTVPESGSGS